MCYWYAIKLSINRVIFFFLPNDSNVWLWVSYVMKNNIKLMTGEITLDHLFGRTEDLNIVSILIWFQSQVTFRKIQILQKPKNAEFYFLHFVFIKSVDCIIFAQMGIKQGKSHLTMVYMYVPYLDPYHPLFISITFNYNLF